MLIETVVRDFLKTKVDCPVTVGIPDDRKEKMVCIQKIDASKEDQINGVTLEIHSYGKTKLESAELDEQIQNHMDTLYELPEVMACIFGGGNDNPETNTKSFRYRSYFNVYF